MFNGDLPPKVSAVTMVETEVSPAAIDWDTWRLNLSMQIAARRDMLAFYETAKDGGNDLSIAVASSALRKNLTDIHGVISPVFNEIQKEYNKLTNRYKRLCTKVGEVGAEVKEPPEQVFSPDYGYFAEEVAKPLGINWRLLLNTGEYKGCHIASINVKRLIEELKAYVDQGTSEKEKQDRKEYSDRVLHIVSGFFCDSRTSIDEYYESAKKYVEECDEIRKGVGDELNTKMEKVKSSLRSMHGVMVSLEVMAEDGLGVRFVPTSAGLSRMASGAQGLASDCKSEIKALNEEINAKHDRLDGLKEVFLKFRESRKPVPGG